MEDSSLSASEIYLQMGFQPHTTGPSVEAALWRRLQASQRLGDVAQKYQIWKELAGAPLVDQGFIVGWVPSLGLGEEEVAKLLKAVESALQLGLETVAELRLARS